VGSIILIIGQRCGPSGGIKNRILEPRAFPIPGHAYLFACDNVIKNTNRK
jgi:hypothetical protein